MHLSLWHDKDHLYWLKSRRKHTCCRWFPKCVRTLTISNSIYRWKIFCEKGPLCCINSVQQNACNVHVNRPYSKYSHAVLSSTIEKQFSHIDQISILIRFVTEPSIRLRIAFSNCVCPSWNSGICIWSWQSNTAMSWNIAFGIGLRTKCIETDIRIKRNSVKWKCSVYSVR